MSAPTTDPRDAEIAALVAENEALHEKLSRKDEACNDTINAALTLPDPVREQLVAALKDIAYSKPLTANDKQMVRHLQGVAKDALTNRPTAANAAGLTDREIMEEWNRHYLPGKAEGVPFLQTVVAFARHFMARPTAVGAVDLPAPADPVREQLVAAVQALRKWADELDADARAEGFGGGSVMARRIRALTGVEP
jgi:lambda repressor-like predicted transcriptional regulator